MTNEGGSVDRRGRSQRRVGRRGVLAAIGGFAALPTSTRRTRADRSAATLHVRAYPGPMPLYVWLRNCCWGIRTGWSPIHRDAIEAVEETLETLARVAERRTGLDRVEVRVERLPAVDLSMGPTVARAVTDAPTADRKAIFETFRRLVRRRDGDSESCCHLLLWWDPIHYELGYGGTSAPNTHVAKFEDEGAQTIANVGATEVWDSRTVTRNIAIHETLHTFLSDDVVEDVVGTPCDHNLGSVVRTDRDAVRVSPMATAYGGPSRIGGGTRFHGTGCFDHDEFFRHDGYEDVDRWEYVREPSDATKEAVALYVDRHLAE